MTTALAGLPPAVARAVADAHSPHTRRAYRQRLGAFLSAGYAIPAAPESVAAYLVRLAGGGKAMSSVRLAQSAIAAAHRAAGFPNPCAAPVVKLAVKGAARRHGRPQTQAGALTAAALAAIRATALLPRKGRGGALENRAAANRRGTADIALCAVMSDAGLRRSEAAALVWADVEPWPDGSGRLTVRRSKTDSEGEGAVVAVSRSAMEALEAVRPGSQDGAAPVYGLSESQIHRRIQAAAIAAGLGRGYGGHSGRVGMARRMSAAGAPTDAVMRQGRWKTPRMVAHYTRGEAAGEALRYLA